MSSKPHPLHSEPLFVEGRRQLKEKNFEAAIEFFSNLVKARVDRFGDQSIEAAPAWFEYGNALLLTEEENPTDDLLGAAAAEAKKAAKALGDEMGGASTEQNEGSDEEDDESNDGDVEINRGEEEEEESDMQVAWECLEVARKSYNAYLRDGPSSSGVETDAARPDDDEVNLSLAEVYCRLGDLQKFNGNFPGAISEYGKCLKIRSAICPVGDRLLSEANYNLAVAHIYNSGEEGVDVIAEKRNAMRYYRAAREVLMAARNSGSVSAVAPVSDTVDAPSLSAKEQEDANERKELADELNETIGALNVEIQAALKAMLQGTAAGSSFSSGGGATTTIGFGQASRPSAAAVSSSGISSAQAVTSSRAVSEGSAVESAVLIQQPVNASQQVDVAKSSAAAIIDGGSQSVHSPAKKRIRLDTGAVEEKSEDAVQS